MKIAQVLYGKAHWIFDSVEVFGIDEIPKLPPDQEGVYPVLVDITGKEVSEGFEYDERTGEFIKPVEVLPIEPKEPPLSETEQAILQTAVNTEYLVSIEEMKI